MDNAYGLKSLPANRRVSAAQFLLKYNAQGKYAIPNYVFTDSELRWTDDDVDIKVSTCSIDCYHYCTMCTGEHSESQATIPAPCDLHVDR